MICLQCGAEQSRPGVVRCSTCQVEFRPASGLFGVNNISQLLGSIEDLRSGAIDLAELRERFGTFLDVWDQFCEKWGLVEVTVPTAFGLNPELESVYGPLLQQLEDSIEELNKALDGVDNLSDADAAQLEEIEDHIRRFCRSVCSACAGMFTKLESRGGDFASLLDNFAL
jgi:hypothetical protein